MRRLGLLVVALAVLAACGGEESGSRADEAAGPRTSSAAGDGVALEGKTLDGAPLSLADFRGKPVFVNVWASW
jgi:hypothetical protein